MSSENENIALEQTPHLTEAYQKARRNLSLSSGILLAWEYVGVRISTSTAELPVAKTPVSLLNPEVLPHVIFLMVLYFSGRITIEWLQCNEIRRQQTACRLDFSLGITLASCASLLYVFQNAYGIRIASFTEWSPPLFVLGIIIYSLSFYIFNFAVKDTRSKIAAIVTSNLVLIVLVFSFFLGEGSSFFVGMIIAAVILLIKRVLRLDK